MVDTYIPYVFQIDIHICRINEHVLLNIYDLIILGFYDLTFCNFVSFYFMCLLLFLLFPLFDFVSQSILAKSDYIILQPCLVASSFAAISLLHHLSQLQPAVFAPKAAVPPGPRVSILPKRLLSRHWTVMTPSQPSLPPNSLLAPPSSPWWDLIP